VADLSPLRIRIDEIRAKAGEVLADSGLTIDDATLLLLSKIADEGMVPEALLTTDDAYDRWFRARVDEARTSARPHIAHGEVTAEFARLKDDLRRRSDRPLR
jgi:DNA-damage-inducible protein J